MALLRYELGNSRSATANDNSVSNPLTPTQPNSRTRPTASKVTGKVGQAVNGHTFRFTVSTVKCGMTKVGDNTTFEIAKGQYCLVTLTVQNVTGAAAPFWYSAVSVDGPDGAAYRSDGAAMFAVNKKGNHLPFFNKIDAGKSLTGILVFDIPTNVTPMTINLPEDLTSVVSIAVG